MVDTSAYDDIDTSPDVTTPDTPAARGYLRRMQETSKSAGANYEDIMRRRSDAVAAVQRQLNDTIAEMRAARSGAGPGQVNLPLLAFGAGMLSPTPGVASNFATELGRGMSAMGSTIQKQRMTDSDFLKGLAELQMRNQMLGDLPLKDAAAYEARRGIAADAAGARVEGRMLAKSGPGSANLAELEAENAVRAKKGQPPLSPAEWYEFKSKTGSDRNTPADLRQRDEENKARAERGLPPLSPAEWQELKSSSQAGGREKGKSRAEAEIALPATEMDIDTMLQTLDRVSSHPGKLKSLGWKSYLPNVAGGEAENFQKIVDQLTNQAFLAQFQKMRGAGQITEIEGKKATDALMQLSTSQSPKQFDENLKIARDILEKGRVVAKTKAGQKPPTPPMEGAKQAPDGKWYVEKDGQLFEVRP